MIAILLLLLTFAPPSLHFEWKVGDPPPFPQPVVITDVSIPCEAVSFGTDSPWLWVTQNGCSTTSKAVAVSIQTTGLVVGKYTGNVLVNAEHIPVTLTVTN